MVPQKVHTQEWLAPALVMSCACYWCPVVDLLEGNKARVDR